MNRADEPTTTDLLMKTAATRARVQADLERLSTELTPAELKERALDAAERSVESLGRRALRRTLLLPSWAARQGRAHPVAAAAVGGAVVGLLAWRIAKRWRE